MLVNYVRTVLALKLNELKFDKRGTFNSVASEL